MLVTVSFVCRSVVDGLVPFQYGLVYGFCGTSPILQLLYFCNSNSHMGVDRRMGLHSRLGVGYPLQGVVVDVGVLLVVEILQAVGVLLGLGVGPALVLVVPLYSVLCVLLPGVGVRLPASIVRKVLTVDIMLS